MEKGDTMKGHRDDFVLQVLNKVKDGEKTKKDAASALGISPQYMSRIMKRYEAEGKDFLVHGNRGKPSPRKTEKGLTDEITRIHREEYDGFNFLHFAERLAEDKGMSVS